MFDFSTAVGLVLFLAGVTKGGRRVKFCVGEDSCSFQTTKEGSKSTLLVATRNFKKTAIMRGWFTTL